jgi:hypothetical protein
MGRQPQAGPVVAAMPVSSPARWRPTTYTQFWKLPSSIAARLAMGVAATVLRLGPTPACKIRCLMASLFNDTDIV